jgi:hypothetical protein
MMNICISVSFTVLEIFMLLKHTPVFCIMVSVNKHFLLIWKEKLWKKFLQSLIQNLSQ